MSKRRALLIMGLVGLAAAAGAAEPLDFARIVPVPASAPIPTQDFFRPPQFSNPELNPAGTRFAARAEAGNDQLALVVGDLDQLTLRTFSNYKDEDVDWFSWLDDNRVLTYLIGEKRYPRGLFVTDTNTARSYPVARFSAFSLVGVPVKSPTKPLLWVYWNANDSGKNLGVVQLDAERRLGEYEHPIPGSFQDSVARDEAKLHGVRAPVAGSFPNPPADAVVVSYLADAQGELAFAITALRGTYTLFRFAGQKWERTPVDLDQYYPLAAGDRPGELIVLGPRQGDRPRALHRLDTITGQLGEQLVQDNAYDLTTSVLYRHPVTHRILGVKFHRTAQHTVWFDESHAAVQKTLAARFPNFIVNILGSNAACDRFFFSTSTDRQPLAYHTLDTKTGETRLVRNSAPWIDPARMRPTSVIRLKTRDGYQLECFLTAPERTAGSAPPPVVVLPHGGPHTRDAWGFNGEVQFLASRGYAVLQVNYRGSTGYAWMFPSADLWDFRKMHDDVTEAALLVGKTGLIDTGRMAIMGTSFGGYLALCGAAFEPDRYRCAITVSGVFDWARAIEEQKVTQFQRPGYGIFVRALGDPREKPDAFAAISPLQHLGRVKIPLFVAHGREDSIADYRESRDLIASLEKLRIPHESLIVAREGHGMSYTRNQVELYDRIAAFLDENLQPKP